MLLLLVLNTFLFNTVRERRKNGTAEKPAENVDGIMPLLKAKTHTAADISDDEDFAKLWCYCSKPAFWQNDHV